MKKKPDTFFDDIIKSLKIESELERYTLIAPKVLEEFYSAEIPGKGKSCSAQNAVAHPSESAKMPSPPPLQVEPAALMMMNMQVLYKTALSCSRCPLAQNRKNVVFGAGNPNADLMFIGEGPGRDEDEKGVPFVGEAGQLLTKMVNAMQFTRSDIYIANIVKCRPPKNRNPEQAEAEACLPFLKRQIELVNPKVIVLLGAVPLFYLMNKKGITRVRGEWMRYGNINVMPTFHPAYLLRFPGAKPDVWKDLQKVMQVLGKTYSPVKKRR